jgi:hypothetical protein
VPNYIKNRLTVKEKAGEVFAFLKGDESAIDFNKIIPMPECLNIDETSLGDEGMKYLYLSATEDLFRGKEIDEIKNRLIQRKQFEEAVELGKKYLLNIANTGSKTWYDWSRKNWGTKWNALEPSIVSENCIEFDTAWNGVVELMEKLSTVFPESTFEYKYADEDTGCNCGHGTIKNGVSEMVFPEKFSREAYELAFELRPYCAKYYRLEDGSYVSKEDEEQLTTAST